MRLAYLGPPGTFSEEAAVRFLPDAELVRRVPPAPSRYSPPMPMWPSRRSRTASKAP